MKLMGEGSLRAHWTHAVKVVHFVCVEGGNGIGYGVGVV